MSSSNNSLEYGIYNEGAGTISIGTKDAYIHKDVVTIEAKYGMRNYLGKLYWYDGTFIYNTLLLEGNITEIEDYAKIIENEGEGYLEIITEPIEWIQNTTTQKTYSDFQIAINETNERCTLQVIQDYTQCEAVNIQEEKHIILDLNGKTVTTYGSIWNQGTFLITDSVGNGTMTSQVGTIMIQNAGTVEMSRRNDF